MLGEPECVELNREGGESRTPKAQHEGWREEEEAKQDRLVGPCVPTKSKTANLHGEIVETGHVDAAFSMTPNVRVERAAA